MKNIPMFTSSYGLATLILREIAWNGRAYVLVRSVWNDQAAELLDECRQFCRAVGAEEVYASWDAEELPADHAYDMIDMTCPKAALPVPRNPVELEQVRPETAEDYLLIYKQCFRDVSSAASYDRNSLEPLYGEDLAWLAKTDGQYAAVAEISKEGLEGIAVLPEYRGRGYGKGLLRELSRRAVAEGCGRLEWCCLDWNQPSIDFYRSLGAVPMDEWTTYRLTGESLKALAES